MVITVRCPSCGTSFPVDTDKVPEGGVNARCSECAAIFRVERPDERPEPSTPEPGTAVEVPVPVPVPMERAATTPPEGPALEVASEEPAAEAAPEDPVAEAPPEHSLAARPPAAEQELGAGELAGADVAAEKTAGREVAAEEVTAEAEPEGTGEGSAEPPAAETWVLETQEDLDASSLDVAPMGTVESTVEETRDRLSEGPPFGTPSGFETAETLLEGATGEGERQSRAAFEEEPLPTLEREAEAPGEAAPAAVERGAEAPGGPEPSTQEPEPAAEAGLAAPETVSPPAAKQGFRFGQRDPHEKARRLARVLVSDMIMYNPERHERALAAGTLKEDFEDEIRKSWKEYVDQVGEEIARGTSYWPEALNDVLAKGQQIF